MQLSFNETNDAARWNNQPYHEEVHFPTQPMSGGAGGGTLHRSNAGRFSAGKLNKSSSMHDIAHGLAAATNVAPAPSAGGAGAEFNPMRNVLVSNDGVSWEDQQLPGVPHWQTTQSAINHPAMSGLLSRPSVNSAQFRKTNGGAGKAAHRQHAQQQQQPPSEFWNPMWSAAAAGAPPPLHGSHAAFDPTMNPFHNPMMTPMHRSMHDLHSAVSGGFMMGQPQGPQSYQHAAAAAAAAQFMAQQQQQQQRASSPSNASQKSKRSGGKIGRKTRRRSGGGGSRPHSRNVSSRNSRARPGSSVAATSTEEEEEGEGEGEPEDDEDDSDSEDFFTGESDAGGSGGGTAPDYVAPPPPPPTTKGKGGSSVPRKAWMCEHCTFMNSAGTSVCTVCCRTSKHSRSGAAGPAPNETAKHSQGHGGATTKNKSKKAKDGARSASTTRRPRYNSSDDDDDGDDDDDFAEDHSDFGRQRASKANRLPGLQQQHRGRHQKLESRGRAGMAKSMTDLDSLGPHGGIGAGYDEFDLEQDALNTYYAVRMGERRRSTALMRRGDDEGELRPAI